MSADHPQPGRPHAGAMEEREYIAHRAAAFAAWLDTIGLDVRPGDPERAERLAEEIQQLRDERRQGGEGGPPA